MRSEPVQYLLPPLRSPIRGRGPINLAARLDFTTLKLFVAIVEEQSFSKAAERELIAPSAVSKRIADLESAMRVELLIRQSKLPTAPGKVLLHYARGILADVAKLEEEITEHASGARGLVRIATSESALTRFVPDVLPPFSERHPNIRIDLRTEVSSAVVRMVLEGSADLGIFWGTGPVDGLDVVPCYTDRLVVVAARAHPAAGLQQARLADLLDYEFVEQEVNSVVQELMERSANGLGRPIRTRTRVGGYEAACSMARAGFGLAIVPDSFVDKHAGSIGLAVIQLDEPWAVRQYNLCTRGSGQLSTSTRLVVEHFHDHLADPSRWRATHGT